MSLRSFAVGLLSLSLACGGAAPPAGPVVVPADTISAAPPRNLRAPSAAVAQRFVFGTPPHVRIYVDFETLGKSAIAQAIVGELEKAAGPDLASAQRACLTGFVTGARELAVGFHQAEHGDMLMVLRFDPTKLDAEPCMGLAGGGRFHAVVDGNVLLVGEEASVLRAKKGGGSNGLAGLELAEGRVGAFDVAIDQGVRAKGSLEMTAERFQLAASLVFPEDDVAARVEHTLAERTKNLADLPPAAASLSNAIHVSRAGTKLDVDFTLTEPVADQARELGAAAALGVFAVRKYLVSAKLAEARNTVNMIARSLVSYYESETTTGARRKLVACPPVPKVVPRGVAYQSSPADWKAWEPLRFEMTEPQRFQYEVKVDKTGQHAEVLARGDLNGDGKTSLLRYTVDGVAAPTPKKGTSSSAASAGVGAVVRMGTKIEETDPEE